MTGFGRTIAMGLLVTGMALGAQSVFVSPAVAGREHHPKIRQAVHALENAKADLQRANHDFKGHRVDAIRAIDEAVKQLNLCLQVDP